MSGLAGNIMETPLIKYGLMLKAAREYTGFTQKEVGEFVGVSITSVSAWETGRKLPSQKSLDTLIKLYAGYIEDHHNIETFMNMTKKELINRLLENMN
jgi:transcriptional regulator with XRE-family HTH domain